MRLNQEDLIQLCLKQFQEADNMTDELQALSCFTHHDSPLRETVLSQFYDKWENEELVVDKWFSLQAMSERKSTLSDVKKLMQHPAFDIKNPNKVRALIGTFCQGNPNSFHQKDGSGYQFLTEQVLKLDKINPQIAARLLTPFTRWRRYDQHRKDLMKTQLQSLHGHKDLSNDVFEIVEKSLAVSIISLRNN